MGISAFGTAATAQTRPVTRADVSATVGWLAAEDAPDASPYRSWENSLFGSIGAGWYVTDHLKAELDFGAGTDGEVYRSYPVVIDGVRTFQSVRRTVSRRLVGVGAQYQFFRNAWFHPHIALGANLTWDRTRDRLDPIFLFDQVTRTTRILQDGGTEGPRTDFVVRPYVATGFKAYMTRQAFFRADMRVGFKHGVDENIMRFGFGVDF